MVDIKAALKKARSSGNSNTPRGRAVVEVESFDAKNNTATGTIVDGAGKGTKITFELSGKLGVADYTKGSKTRVREGGTLQVEGLAKGEGDVYTTKWVKTFQADPRLGHQLHTTQVHALKILTNRSGATVTRNANVDILDVAGEVHVTDAADLRKAMVEAIDKTGAVAVITVSEEGDPIISNHYARSKKLEDNTYVRETGEEVVSQFETRLADGSKTTLVDLYGEAARLTGVSVVPVTSMRVGNDTWMDIEKRIDEGLRGGPIDKKSYDVATVGKRMASAYAGLKVDADREAVVKAFLDQANEDAKAKFREGGFAAVADRDIRKFIEAEGVRLMDIGDKPIGYVTGAMLTRPFNPDDPTSGSMVTKTFSITAASPIPAVKALEDVRKRYYDEMPSALKTIAERVLASGLAMGKTDGAAPAVSSADMEAAASPAVADPSDIHDLDELIGALDDDLGDLEP